VNSLKSFSNSRENNFQLIRLAAALGVFISHTFPLAGYGLGGKAQMLGHVSLNVFFVISGFLVCKSYLDRPTKIYVTSRILRIFPALIAAVLFSVFGIGLAMTELGTLEYLSNAGVYEYTLKNIVLLIPDIPKTLPGVFLEYKYLPTVNAPLWSLPYEVMCYILLAVLGLVTRAKNQTTRLIVVALTIFSICYTVYVANTISKSDEFAFILGKDFYRLLGMFFLGVSMYLLSDEIPISHILMAVLVLLFGLSLLYRPSSIVLLYLVGAYAIFYFAYIPRGSLLKFNSIGDYSYGVYILGYPIQQTVEQLFPDLSLPVYFSVTFLITLSLAIASWHLLESRVLSFKKTM